MYSRRRPRDRECNNPGSAAVFADPVQRLNLWMLISICRSLLLEQTKTFLDNESAASTVTLEAVIRSLGVLHFNRHAGTTKMKVAQMPEIRLLCLKTDSSYSSDPRCI